MPMLSFVSICFVHSAVVDGSDLAFLQSETKALEEFSRELFTEINELRQEKVGENSFPAQIVMSPSSDIERNLSCKFFSFLFAL